MPFRGQHRMYGWLFLNQKLGNHLRSLGGMWIRKIVKV
jgi:hypothetical protein